MPAAAAVLQKCFSPVFELMHAARASALIKAVQALLASRRLILMEMARAWPGADQVRAPLKSLDRLLSNSHLHAQREALYAQMMRWLIRTPSPIILVDWSDLHADCRWQLLRAAVPMGGRTITLLEMVFPESKKGSAKAEAELLKRLKALLPSGTKPILVTDAGFRAPWFRAVAKLGWQYVGRLRHRTQIKLQNQPWMNNRKLLSKACRKPQRFSPAHIVASNPLRVDLVLYRKKRAGRVQLNRYGEPKRSARGLKAQRRERDPWLLVASRGLGQLSAKQIVAIYAKRMQIEESFRDLKCPHFGCGFYHSLTRKPQRIATLLLIQALASFVTWLASLSMTHTATRQYGGVLGRGTRRHYSVFRIAWEALKRSDPICTARALFAAFLHPPDTFFDNSRVPS